MNKVPVPLFELTDLPQTIRKVKELRDQADGWA